MKFPLTLSCGHNTSDNCSCQKNKLNTYKSDGESPIDKAIYQFQGRWRDVLSNYGCKVPSGGKHGA